MGLLDQVIGGVLGQVLGGGHVQERGGQGGGQGGGGGALGGAMSPIVQALLMLLMSKGAGGLGDILGGGRHQDGPSQRRSDDAGGGYEDRGSFEDRGGFGQDAGGRDAGGYEPRGREGDFGDLAGMLDGPGERNAGTGRDPGAGPYAHLDRAPGDGGGGLDGLIDRFQRGGLGDVIESWIGNGENRSIPPNRLADALGPETVGALEQRTGLDRGDLLAQLAQALPQVVNGLTPHGRRPTGDDQRGW